MQTRRYILYSDEAYTAQPQLRYHHYYGGLLIDERFVDHLEKRLNSFAEDAGLTGEIKWGKVDEKSRLSYEQFVKVFFAELAQGYFKIRVLFLDKYLKPKGLVKTRDPERFFILYYQFVTRAFGWSVAPFAETEKITLRFFFDELPIKGNARAAFKAFLSDIPNTRRFGHLTLEIPKDGIAEIDSRDHRIAQAVDLLIGSLGYRMNHFQKVVAPSGRRGKRTTAKDRVSKLVQARLKTFGVKNIGITTGCYRKPLALWNDPIRLWRMEPKDFDLDRRWIRNKAPRRPT